MYPLWEALESAKKYRWVELSHSLNNDSPYWAGIPEGSVELAKTVFDWGNPMLECLIQTFKFPGQFGTHIDFPGHFIKDAALSEKYGVKDLIFPLCVIDVTDKVKENPEYAVTPEDIQEYEDDEKKTIIQVLEEKEKSGKKLNLTERLKLFKAKISLSFS